MTKGAARSTAPTRESHSQLSMKYEYTQRRSPEITGTSLVWRLPYTIYATPNAPARMPKMNWPIMLHSLYGSIANDASQAERRQPRMIVGPPPERPVILAIAGSNGEIVDAGYPASHEALVIELPVLVAVRPEPATRVVVPLVSETNSNSVALTSPKFLDQPVVELLDPLASEELLDRLPAGEELRAVAPHAIGCVGQGHALRVARVPGVFGQPNLLRGGACVERRKGRTGLLDRRHGQALLNCDDA